MTRKEVFKEINAIQDYYIDELIKLINSPEYDTLKTISFTSPTGTGKTKMMSKLINKYSQYYFIITTLSKGQLHIQVRNSLLQDCNQNNYKVYGSADYKINSLLEAEDIINEIPVNTKCIWLRDEGHIRTNRFEKLLVDVCFKIINFSATNTHSDIVCNFTQTMMLRTVYQTNGSPLEAINKLIEVKKMHREVSKYNPCAIFRCIGGDEYLYKEIVKLCKMHKLKYIDITDDKYDMSDLCRDDNQYDVIINKYKLVEGIDIRRAHVLFMDNQPKNPTTTIQAIGRCRRNALLYRDDIDIMSSKNKRLLEHTRKCYVYYHVDEMKIDTDEYGELQYAFCDHISCEALKSGMSIQVLKGQLPNGLYVIELEGKTGKFNIVKDEKTGCNIVEPVSEFYDNEIVKHDINYLYTHKGKIHVDNIKKLPVHNKKYDINTGQYVDTEPFFELGNEIKKDVEFHISKDVIRFYKSKVEEYTKDNIRSRIKENSLDYLLAQKTDINIVQMKMAIKSYVMDKSEKKGYNEFCHFISDIDELEIEIGGFKYLLKDVCTKNEITIITYFCIQKKDKYVSNDNIIDYISLVLNQRRELFARIYYSSEIKKSIFFDTSKLSCYKTWGELRDFINKFIEDNERDKRFEYFVKLLLEMNSSDADNNIFSDLRKACSHNDIELIQFFCITEKQNGISDEAILEKINRYILSMYRLNLKRENDVLDRLIYILFEQKNNIYYNLSFASFSITVKYPNSLVVDEKDVEKYFVSVNNAINNMLTNDKKSYYLGCYRDERVLFANSELIMDSIMDDFARTDERLKNNIIPCVVYDYSILFEKLTATEDYLMRNNYLHTHHSIYESEIDNYKVQIPYSKTINDRESAIVGVDLMKQIKDAKGEVFWSESTTVTSKIGNYNKLNTFISNYYVDELEQAKEQYVTGHNNFKLDKKCNSMIGYCVEYFSKYLVYGEDYLGDYIKQAQNEMHVSIITDAVIVRACIIKYRVMMISCYGIGVSKVIKSIGAESLLKKEYQYFINLIVELGNRTAKYVRENLYLNKEPKDNVDTDLSIKHITGLADYITEDTILDVKVRNYIDEKSVRQVLAYHYLSTKRSDLHIKRVIVYDATSDNSVVINISADKIV